MGASGGIGDWTRRDTPGILHFHAAHFNAAGSALPTQQVPNPKWDLSEVAHSSLVHSRLSSGSSRFSTDRMKFVFRLAGAGCSKELSR